MKNKRQIYVVTEKRLERAKKWMAPSEHRYFVRLLRLVAGK